MLEKLSALDPRLAAGILAHAALRVAGDPRPEMVPLIERQWELEEALINELRAALQVRSDDYSAETLERLADALDREAEDLTEPRTNRSVLDRAGTEGRLPSDLYEVSFSPTLQENFGYRWHIEERLALETVRQPHREQIFSKHPMPGEPALITLFARFYTSKYPARSFWLIVAGQRSGRLLNVSQVWRAYPSLLDLSGCTTILDAIKAIADKYGHPIEIDGRASAFHILVPAKDAAVVRRHLELQARAGQTINVSFFMQAVEGKEIASLFVAVDFTKYLRSIEERRGWDKAAFSELRPMLEDEIDESWLRGRAV